MPNVPPMIWNCRWSSLCSLQPTELEVSIGHTLIADALEFGLAETVWAYQRCIQNAFAPDLPARSTR